MNSVPMKSIAVTLVLALTLVGCGKTESADTAAEGPAAIPVAARPAETGSLRAVIRASGVVVPAEGAEFLVIAPEPARILEITRAEGDPVSSGDVLVRFDLPGASQEIVRQRAELARIEAQLESARLSQARIRDLVGRGLVARRDLETADRDLAEAQDAVTRATAAVAVADAAAARAVIRAPFSGIVAKRLHNPGDMVPAAATDPVLRLVDPARVEVVATVTAEEAARVLPGASARLVNAVAGATVALSVASRGTASGNGNAVPVRLASASPLTVPVDTAIAIEIDAEERVGVVFVAPEAIVRDGNESVVMVAAGDRAERRVVQAGVATERRVEVVSGLRAGELVITQGHVGLPDGALINAAVR
jgi:RND family efflux transporter MFP subunit